MFAIYEKNEKEILIEQAQNPNKLVCPYSIPVYQNGKVHYIDTYDLTETQILGLIQTDLFEFISPNSPYSITGLKAPIIFRLLTLLHPDFSPSTYMVLQLTYAEMLLGRVVTKIMRLLKCDDILDKATDLAQEKKNNLQDSTPISKQDIIDALHEMVDIEQKSPEKNQEKQAKKPV